MREWSSWDVYHRRLPSRGSVLRPPLMTGIAHRRGLGIGASVMATALLIGCIARGVDIPPEASDIRACEPQSEPYPVERINDAARAECDLAGETIVFPDGYEMGVPAIGVTSAEDILRKDEDRAPVYHVFSFGAFGLVVGRLSADGKRSEWCGTDEGLRRYHAVRGTDVPPLSGD